jgi:hypothetical protein
VLKTLILIELLLALLVPAPAEANPAITLTSPLDYQVIQRSSKNKGIITISGEVTDATAKNLIIEARLSNGPIGKWQRLSFNRKHGTFESRMAVAVVSLSPIGGEGQGEGASVSNSTLDIRHSTFALGERAHGGWYRLEVRARAGTNLLAETAVEHVGIGEVFVIAGQSNSANHGEEKQNTRTGLVAAFDGKRWRLANDPQPGASGGGGSFMPLFGDAIAERFHVPVGIVACGVGATSVREWLPKGARFPNPPTLTNHVRQLPEGDWESKGTVFTTFTERMRQLGRHGFRALLWHQGESDANQDDPTRTLRGELYREYLEQLIRSTRREIGWKAPWFVAQASYHQPGDEASPDIRAAQAAVWKDGFALQGPDTDALKGALRDSEGRGVHFSGAGLRAHAEAWVQKVTPWLERQVR